VRAVGGACGADALNKPIVWSPTLAVSFMPASWF
jgi:hypothetical protein